ncbi:MAG: thiamine-phosphate kinase [Dehalococcoidia bacterium]
MKASESGEFGLIEILRRMVAERGEIAPDLILGIGDDAAAWQVGESVQLGSTDMLVAGIHFNMDMISWHDLGWKALAVNISDIAAMGGMPEYAMISLGLPADAEVERVTELYQGMTEIARQFGVRIIGGDTVEAPVLTVSPVVIGRTEKGRLMTRSGAEPGDLIAVTGNLGTSAAGLRMLRGKMQFDPETETLLRKAHLKPLPRVDEGRLLSRGGVKAAIDISDGLIADLTHVCRASRVGASLSAENIPIHPTVRDCFPNESLSLAISGGEDYELLFTAPKEIIESIKQQLADPITIIGEIVPEDPGEVKILDEGQNLITPKKGGWEHFGDRL